MSAPCEVCGAPLAPGAKRCGACGAPPAPIARRVPGRPVLDAVAEVTPQTRRTGRLCGCSRSRIDVVVLVLAVGVGYAVAGRLRWAPRCRRVVEHRGLRRPRSARGRGAHAVAPGGPGRRDRSAVPRSASGRWGRQTHRPAGMSAIAVRVLVELAGALVALVGAWVVVASGAWDSSTARRGWHDKAARTLVLRARAVRSAGVEGPGTAPAVARALGPLPVLGLVRPAPGSVATPPAAPTSVGPIISTAPGLVRAAPWTSITVSSAVEPVEVITGPPGRRPAKVASPASPAELQLIDVPNRLVSGMPSPVARGPVIGAPPTEAISIRRDLAATRPATAAHRRTVHAPTGRSRRARDPSGRRGPARAGARPAAPGRAAGPGDRARARARVRQRHAPRGRGRRAGRAGTRRRARA